MGTALVVLRLAWRDVRRHRAQAVLLVVAIAAASAALAMGLAMNGVTSVPPYTATRAATDGPDVVAYLSSPSQARGFVHAAQVAASSGPYPVASATIRFDGRIADVFAEGRTTSAAAVDRPLLTGGVGYGPAALWCNAPSPMPSALRWVITSP
jgi:putative ABC transport system permease protein